MATEIGTPAQRRRKLFHLADQLGLTRDERIEIARTLLWRDIVSWKQLDDAQVDRMLDALEGFLLVNWTFQNRPGLTSPTVPSSPDGTRLGPAPDRT